MELASCPHCGRTYRTETDYRWMHEIRQTTPCERCRGYFGRHVLPLMMDPTPRVPTVRYHYSEEN